MKKVVKLSAALFGVAAMTFGLSSCSKDEDSEKCCTNTSDGTTYQFCENDEEVVSTLADYDMTWSDLSALAEYAGYTCD